MQQKACAKASSPDWASPSRPNGCSLPNCAAATCARCCATGRYRQSTSGPCFLQAAARAPKRARSRPSSKDDSPLRARSRATLHEIAGRARCQRSTKRPASVQTCTSPPSTCKSIPVMKLLSSDARNRAAEASSSGRPMRPMGVAAANDARALSACSFDVN